MSTQSIALAKPKTALNCSLVLAWFLIQMLGIAMFCSSKAHGQAAKPKYDVMPYKPEWFTDKKIVSNIKRIRGQITSDPAVLDDPKVVEFFKLIYENEFKSMTQPKEFHNIPARRAQIMKEIDTANRRGNSRAHAGLTRMAFNKSMEIAKGNFHPVARINSVMMIGELNDREMNSLEKKAPVAFADAFAPLIEFISKPEYSDGMKVAALQGLLRHTMLNSAAWSEEQQDQVADLMFSIAESAAPAGRSSDGHGWMQGMAMDVLLVLGNPRGGRPDKLASIVLNMGAKPDASQHILVYTASLSPKVSVPDGFAPQTNAVVDRWAKHLANVIAKEAKRLEDKEKDRPSFLARAMSMGGDDSMDEGSGEYEGDDDSSDEGGFSMSSAAAAQTAEIVRARRMLNYLLESFHLGLTGTKAKVAAAEIKTGLVATTADEAQKGKAQALLAFVDSAMARVNNESTTANLDYAKALRKLEKRLKAFLDPNAAKDDNDPGEAPNIFIPDEFSFEPSIPAENIASAQPGSN